MVVRAHAIVGCFYSATKHVFLIHRKKKFLFRTAPAYLNQLKLQAPPPAQSFPDQMARRQTAGNGVTIGPRFTESRGEMRGEQGWACVINEELIGKIWENMGKEYKIMWCNWSFCTSALRKQRSFRHLAILGFMATCDAAQLGIGGEI